MPILGALAQDYTLFDAYHCSLMDADLAQPLLPAVRGHRRRRDRALPAPRAASAPRNLELAIFDRLQRSEAHLGLLHVG